MPYTSAQQAKLDQAKSELDAARKKMDASYSKAITDWNGLKKCEDAKGQNTPLSSGKIPAFPNMGKETDCQAAPALPSCKTDCCSKETCRARMSAYNASVTKYVADKKSFDIAKANYDTVLNEITIELENDPELQSQIAAAQQEAADKGKVTLVKWILFGTAVVIIVGTFVYIRFIKKAA